ncbi:M56 family metallopeptidase [Chryseobacterium sp. MMS23-Vi53]|uniref:M56 family metallopeptidase n=1 Tax=Chryseobacterium sp. MMS23-Vi53 TaxID=3386644 RepID=UPI0039ED580D
METLFSYLIKIVICTAVLLGYYYLFLKDKTFHHYNRFYLLSALPLSLLIPLIKVENFTIEVSRNIYFFIERMQTFSFYKNADNHENIYLSIVFLALGFISLFFLLKFLLGIFKIEKLKKQFQKEQIQNINFYRTDLTNAPFSYFKNLFWKNSIELNSEVGRQILKHEMVHIEQKHTVDKMIVEIIASSFWFNPFYHIIKKELSLIHEYLADNKSVQQSDTKMFAQMLLTSHFSGNELPATNPFLSSNLKKRLTMLQKPKTKFGYTRRIFALPLVCTMIFAYMVNAKNKEIREINIKIDQAVSQMKKDTITPQKNQDKGEIKTTKNRLATEKSENEYARFYRDTEKRRLELIKQNEKSKQELIKTIESHREELAFDEKFPKNRDYDKKPLTEEEKNELKEDAEQIEKLSKARVTQVNSNSGYGFFKFDKTTTKVFDINGNEIKNDAKSPVGNPNMMTIFIDGAELFVNGNKVSKDEFLQYQANFKGASDAPANIKLFKIERVGDLKRSYAKRMEIITN